MTDAKQLDALFPLPSLRPSSICPEWVPGVTYESKVTISKALKKNHVQRHAFVNEYGFHNHTSHHLLAVFAMGAPAPLFEEIFGDHAQRTLPTLESPGVITKDNFYDHIGDRRFYDAYLHYFHDIVLEQGASAVVEEYVFSRAANFPEPESDNNPRQIIVRSLAMLYHPMIYLGYGLEFGIPGLVAEGLAQSVVHPLQGQGLLSVADFRAQNEYSGGGSGLVSSFASLVLSKERNGLNIKHSSVHVLTILGRILRDDRFSSSSLSLSPKEHPSEVLTHYDQVARDLGDAMRSHIQGWTVNGSDTIDVKNKVEELCWMNALLYGVGGWGGRNETPDRKFNADFFFMHMVTSALFLPSMVTYLSASSITQLLRTYLISSITWWVARGRPVLPIREFYTSVSATPVPYGTTKVTSAPGTLTSESVSPNPWLPILQTTIVHADDHLCKLQRALAHFASKYGDRPVGYFSAFAEIDSGGLEGAEVLDGSLFVRAAGLTADKLGWMREGQARGEWSYGAFYTRD
ncbi:uncharacterized protein FIBRA_01035 [Fibroporia radiculosa]|uniref:Oxidoreductase AflY n=1 Tax=Fibroporia radiculosa TaxID=599839 RepID=J4I896_9APHY|nr:uncharacterized protein FIBRA_01035 [Fibroporia radiculosa]CCL99026.1 predicted protein [Fibroporia radiculosa]